MSDPTLPDHQLIAFARFARFLSSEFCIRGLHEVWALQRARNSVERNAPLVTRRPPASKPSPSPARPTTSDAIAAAAKELDRLRNNWLNPPEWTRTEVLEFPGTADGPWRRYIDPHSVPDAGSVRDTSASPIGTVRYPRIVPKDEDSLKKRHADQPLQRTPHLARPCPPQTRRRRLRRLRLADRSLRPEILSAC